jgi:hypothetical protein
MGVTIGLREIYDKVADIAGQITQLAMLVTTLQTGQQSNAREVSSLETRVRTLEQKPVVTPAAMWTAIGVLATVAGVIAAVIIGILN